MYLLIYWKNVTSISSLPVSCLPHKKQFSLLSHLGVGDLSSEMSSIYPCSFVTFSTKQNEDYVEKKNQSMSMSACWGVSGLCLNKQWNFPAFLFLLIYFLSVLFSQYCNASLDITQASLSCSASAESNLVRSAAARRIRLSFFRLLWNVPFFQHPKYTRQPNCWHVWEGQQDSYILSCPTMQNSTLFI